MQRTVISIVCLALTVSLTGSRASLRRPRSSPRFQNPAAIRLLTAANALAAQAEYDKARQLYLEGLKLTENDLYYKVRFMLGLGNCNGLTHQFSATLGIYDEIGKLVNASTDPDIALWVAANRATVYRRMHNTAAALEAMRSIEPLVRSTTDPLMILQAATVLRDVDPKRSIDLHHQALRVAEGGKNQAAAAFIWNSLGYTALIHGDFTAAEQALSQARSLRMNLGGKQLQPTYYYLARLKRLQGDHRTALSYLQQAAAQREQQFPRAAIELERAHILRASGKMTESLTAYASALESARQWRMQVIPAESFRISTEVDLGQIYRGYIETLMQQYEQTHDRALALRALVLAEQHRTAVFEGTLAVSRNLPPEYWQTLAKYQRALGQSLSAQTPESSQLASKYRLELDEMEARLGALQNSHQINEKRESGFTPKGLQTNLRDTESLLTFYTGEAVSYRWAITRSGFEVSTLPGQAEIAALVGRFRQALQQRQGDAAEAGLALYGVLFGALPATVEAKPDWILSLDGPLFELPFAALTVQKGPESQYLVERHSLRVTSATPGAARPSDFEGRGPFVGIADPVYNPADPRWPSGQGVRARRVELNRLPGTAREVERCARAWNGKTDPVLLTGRGISRNSVRTAMTLEPAVLHVATHVVRHPVLADQVLLALGMQPDGEIDYLGPAEVSAWRNRLGLVTLSGCGSGQGAVLPGLGLFGLTRAWLASGAEAVIATQWPIADGEGGVLAAMYEGMRKDSRSMSAQSIARALRHAQVGALRSRGPQADASQWAAYFLVGKE